MNLQHHELAKALEKQLPKVCVVIGEEIVLVQEALGLLRTKAKEAGFPARQMLMPDSSTDWDRTIAHFAGGSLFADRHFVEVMVPAPLSGGRRRLNEGLLGLMRSLTDTDLLSISLSGTGPGARPEWLREAGKSGLIVQIKPMRGREERAWVQRQLQQRGLDLSAEQKLLLLERTEGNPLAARMEMDRLSLIAGDGDAKVAVSDLGQLSVFQLADSCLQGDAERAMRALRLLRTRASDSGPLIFAVLGRHLQTACRILWFCDRGDSPTEAMEKTDLWASQKRLMLGFLRRMPATTLRAMARRMSSLDATIKGRDIKDPWRELTGLVLAFCGQFPFRRRA